MSERSYVVLFADISGSMQLYESLGDAGAKTLITELQRQLSLVVDQCGGAVQEIIGDEIMARFVEVDEAIQCASLIHQRAESYARESESGVMMRIGMHWGLAIVENGRMFGDTVNVASRVSTIAQGGQTVMTEAMIERASRSWQAVARRFDTAKVKGKSEPLVVYDIPMKPDEVTVIQTVAQGDAAIELILYYGEKSVNFGSEDGVFSIGRALTNDLVVDADSVSRRHVMIERIRDHFVVADKSTNGTHVYISDGEAVYLRREQLPIWGKGLLALGAPTQRHCDAVSGYAGNSAEHVVRYSCRLKNEIS
ncbi:MAG: adenylate/guanylate cyclase domain-containing protein [Granulosicoccaceae bacterium]